MKVKRTREVLKRETHPGGGETLSRGVKGGGKMYPSQRDSKQFFILVFSYAFHFW